MLEVGLRPAQDQRRASATVPSLGPTSRLGEQSSPFPKPVLQGAQAWLPAETPTPTPGQSYFQGLGKFPTAPGLHSPASTTPGLRTARPQARLGHLPPGPKSA